MIDDAAPLSSNKLYVGNLNKATTEEGLQNLFGKQNIANIELAASRVFCWITFVSEAAAAAALLHNGVNLDGFTIKVEEHKPSVRPPPAAKEVVNPNCVYVGNLPSGVEVEQLTELFKQFGQIDNVKLRPFRGPARSGYVTFVDPAAATAALVLNGTPVGDRSIRVEIEARVPRRQNAKKEKKAKAASTAAPAQQQQQQEPLNPLRLFVGNLPRDMDKEALAEIFANCGVQEAVTNRKGFGFVTLHDAAGVAAALELAGTVVRERKITVRPEERRGNNKGGARTAAAQQAPRQAGAAAATTQAAGDGQPKKRKAKKPKKKRGPKAAAAAATGNGAPSEGKTSEGKTGEGPAKPSGNEEGKEAKSPPPKSNPEATVWIGNLPEGTTREEIKAAAEAIGPVQRVRYTTRNQFAFVVFESPASAEQSVKAGAFSIHGASTTVEKLKEKRCRIFVGKLAPTVTEADLRATFEKFGEVVAVAIKSTEEKTFAHVTFATAAEASGVLSAQDITVSGAPVLIEPPRVRSRRRRTGGASAAKTQ